MRDMIEFLAVTALFIVTMGHLDPLIRVIVLTLTGGAL
jgi:hypothetical protein